MSHEKTQNSELVYLSSQGDGDAATELIRRQREGRAMRLYDGPRMGADDEGVAPVTLGIDDDMVTFSCGIPNRDFAFRRDDILPWVLGACDQAMIVAHMLRMQGVVDVGQAMEDRATPGFTCTCTPDPRQQTVDVAFTPVDTVTWKLDLEGVSSFVTGLLRSSVELRWKMQLTADESERVKPFLLGGKS